MARHVFTPERYYTTMGSHPLALRIAPGDTVVTTTVDSIGQDATGEPVTPGFNPMTGPFLVEGAAPGDTLVVRLDRLVPNRPTGVSAPVLAPNVVDPQFVRHLPERSLVVWAVDLARGEASLPTPVPGLEALRLPLEPMLGCFGVRQTAARRSRR
jgi:amidase